MILSGKRTWIKVMGIVMLIVGFLGCASIILLPLSIPAIVGGTRFLIMGDLTDEELLVQIENRKNLAWAIYAIIFIGIIGILGLVFVYCIETVEGVRRISKLKQEQETLINSEKKEN